MIKIFNKIKNNVELDYADALEMLSVSLGSDIFYKTISLANEYSRKAFNNKGVIFAQIGLDLAPCTVNCQFCNLAYDNFNEANSSKMSLDNIIKEVNNFVCCGANEIFLMATAEYDKDEFLSVGKEVRNNIPKNMNLVANIADFDDEYASKLKNVGFTGVYHICRIGEEIVTASKVADRIKTIEAIKNNGLELYYCVEPIGPEHTNEQIADEIFRAIDYNVDVMAVMRRVSFFNSPMEHLGEINALKLALICAVTTLCAKPKRAMGVHEPEIISLISGANQIYAENGSNPRDVILKTEQSRGFSVSRSQKMLIEAMWDI